jgi:hypothetical protein
MILTIMSLVKTMGNNIFSQGLDKVLGAAGGAVSDIGGALNNVFSNTVNYTAPTSTQPKLQTQSPPPQINTANVLNSIKYNETRGEKNPYSYSRYSGSSIAGNALGAYQVTQGELNTYGQKFLGKAVTSQQFLSDPQLQDQYMQAKIQHGLQMGLTLPQIFATHRGGYTHPDNAMVKYKGYVDSALQEYNNLINGQK